MNIRLTIFISVISCFALTMLFAPLVIRLMRRLHASQSILEYVDNHSDKQGTPTMGGVMFIVPIAIVSLIYGETRSRMLLVSVGTMLSFGFLGFLDDFIKVKMRHNEGLKPYQKIIGQLGIGIIVTLFAYYYAGIGSDIRMPFTGRLVHFGYFYIPFTLFVFLAGTNSVNLTDGLDGLATSTTLVYVATFVVILLLSLGDIEGNMMLERDYRGEIIFLSCAFGGLLAFLSLNSNKASIFMGDTGSLALGGIVSVVPVFTRNTLLIPLIGIMYVLTSISVIVQVVYFKMTGGKRIFIMAPLHHHLEYKGLSEAKIVAIYSIITVIAGMVAIVSIN